MGTLLFFIAIAGLIFLMMRFGLGRRRGHLGSAPSFPPDTAFDPVCRMSVGTSWAKSTVYQGRTYYFCTDKCREAFEAEPERYIGSNANSNTMEHSHGSTAAKVCRPRHTACSFH